MDIKKLGEICDVVSGGTPSRTNTAFWDGGIIPWIKIGNIKGKYVSEADEYITQAGLEGSSAKILSKGTVLYTIFATLGEAGILTIDACTNQAIAGITIKNQDEVLADYLYYYLKSKKSYINNLGRGVAQNNINLSILRNLEIPLPALPVQRQTVDILDKTAKVIEYRRQQLQNLDDLVKARFVEMFGDPKSNPHEYEKPQLKETCKVITGNTPSRAIREYYGDCLEWIKTDNIVSGVLNPTAAVEKLSRSGVDVGRTVDAGTILMACIAGSIASIGRVCVTDRKVAFNQQINAIVPQKYNVLFLYTLLQISKDYLVEEINMALKGILSKSKLEEKHFILPPMESQDEFASFVEQVDKSKFVVQQALDKAQLLFDSLMQQYFG